jgi:hypothetical protein
MPTTRLRLATGIAFPPPTPPTRAFSAPSPVPSENNTKPNNDNHEHDQRPMHRMWGFLHRPPLRWLLRMPQLPTHHLRKRFLPLLPLGRMAGAGVGDTRSGERPNTRSVSGEPHFKEQDS